MLPLQQRELLGSPDERRFLLPRSLADIRESEKRIAEAAGDSRDRLLELFGSAEYGYSCEEKIAAELIQSLGRVPTPAEVLSELQRQRAIIEQPWYDHFF